MILEILAYISAALITIGWIIAMGREFTPKIGKLITKINRKEKGESEEEQKIG